MKFHILFIFAMIFLVSCAQNNVIIEIETKSLTNEVIDTSIENKGYKLLKQNCYACHNPNAVSHEKLMAPPMEAVKRRYKASYDNKVDFTEAMTSWINTPEEKSAIMLGAIKKFKLMPKLPYKKADLKLIVDYMWDNELEKPTWFDAHFKEKHPKGMGNH